MTPKKYKLSIEIDEDDRIKIDRLIETGRFTSRSGFIKWAIKCLIHEYRKALRKEEMKKEVVAIKNKQAKTNKQV